MSKFILGSGIIGRLAKLIYPEYEYIPFGRSRYYGFSPPFGENYLVCHNSVDEVLEKLLGYIPGRIDYNRPFSLSGELIYSSSFTATPYVEKVYGETDNLKTRLLTTLMSVYRITIKDIYDMLLLGIGDDLEKYGFLSSINTNKGSITTSTGEYEYSHIISTIPLTMLCKYTSHDMDLKSKPVWIYAVQSGYLDFEGANEVLVVEPQFDFYDVVWLGGDYYMFKSLSEILTPEMYFGAFTNNECKIIKKTKIEEYIPLGQRPNLTWFEDRAILPVGSMARWDDFCDVSTSIHMLKKFTQHQV